MALDNSSYEVEWQLPDDDNDFERMHAGIVEPHDVSDERSVRELVTTPAVPQPV